MITANTKIVRDGQGFHEFKRKSNPYTFHNDFSEYVKSFGDIYFWSKGNFHVITKADLAKDALQDPAISCDRSSFFISRMPNLDLSLISNFFDVVSKMMVMRDGEDHKNRRSIATFGLNDELIDHYSRKIPSFIDKFVKNPLRNEEIDFVKDVSSKLPSLILAELFCIPEQDRDLFYDRSNIMTGFFGGGSCYENKDGMRVNKAAIDLKQYFSDLLRDRRNELKNDFFSGMLRVAGKFNFSDEDLISQAIMMLVAGQVTTTDQMNNIMFQLLNHQEILTKVIKNKSLIPKMIEEFKRLDPAVTFIFRVAKEDTIVGVQPISKGDTIFISTHCINRDESIFKNPCKAMLNRKSNNHFSYGYGAHYCLGARLGRIEMNKLFEYLLKNYSSIKIGSGEVVRDHYSLSFSGFKNLPIILK